jgi:phosphatidylserine decarboxylase
MLKSYLPSFINTLSVIFALVILLLGFYKVIMIYVVIYIFFYLLFRKKANRFRDDPVVTTGVVFSPCNGKVLSIANDEDFLKIEIRIAPWNEMGIFMPISSEVINLWKSKKEVILEISNRQIVLELHFKKRSFGLWPDLIVTPGDKGARQVNIGYFPMGGTVLLYLPKKYEILTKSFTEVIAGETIIAVLPENK